MTIKSVRSRETVSINHARWLGYAAAGVATTFAGAQTAEADIHYSGPINQTFNAPAGGSSSAFFQLDQAGDSINPFHARTNSGFSGVALFFMYGINAASVAGFYGGAFPYASKLASGIALNSFANFVPHAATLAYRGGYSNSQWQTIGTGFVGFRFDNGTGLQYGWARIHMTKGRRATVLR